MITNEALDRLARICEAATPGPWQHFAERTDAETNDPADTGEYEVITRVGEPNVILASELEVDDAEFVVVARAWLPDLIGEVRRLRSPAR